MDGVELLRNRAAVVPGQLRDLAAAAEGIDLTTPVVPGTSPIGLTLWHVPRTQDWLFNTVLRDKPEVADQFRDGLPDPDAYGFGTGLSAEQAARAASQIQVPALLAYAEAVAESVDTWLSSLSDTDLDTAPPLLERQRRRPSYSMQAALAEIEGLEGATTGVLLLRPGLAHLFWHFGEVDVLLQLARAGSS